MGSMRMAFGALRGCTTFGPGVILRHWLCLAVLSVVVAMSASCSDSGNSKAVSGTPPPSGSSPTENFENWLSDHYTAQDVRHTFKTRFGEAIDCIDFFAQPGAKQLARLGKPVTSIPTPPPLPHPEKWARQAKAPMSEYMFNGSLDEDGHARACPAGTVPEHHTTVDELRARHALFPPIPHRHGTPKGDAPRKRGFSQNAATATPEVAEARAGHPSMVPSAPAVDSCGYAHVVSSIYPGASETLAPLVTGTATLSVWNTTTANELPNDGSHTLEQILDDLRLGVHLQSRGPLRPIKSRMRRELSPLPPKSGGRLDCLPIHRQ